MTAWISWTYSPRTLLWSRLCAAPTIGEAHRESLRLQPNVPSRYRGLTTGAVPDWVPGED